MSSKTLEAILAREERLHPKPKAKKPKGDKAPARPPETDVSRITWPAE